MATGRQKRKEEPRKLIMNGPVTVATVGKAKAALQEALGAASAVTVSLESITSVDVSFLQLLCSAHRTAADADKVLTVTGTDQEPVASLLLQAGFLRHIGCHENTRRSCLWVEPKTKKERAGR